MHSNTISSVDIGGCFTKQNAEHLIEALYNSYGISDIIDFKIEFCKEKKVYDIVAKLNVAKNNGHDLDELTRALRAFCLGWNNRAIYPVGNG